MNSTTIGNDNIDDSKQITKSKGLLRQQIRELEAELEAMRNAPLKQEAARLAKENATLLHRIEEVEAAAAETVKAALKLARVASAPLGGT